MRLELLQLAALVRDMRRLQAKFSDRKCTAAEMRDAERRVDRAVAEVLDGPSMFEEEK